MSTTVPSPDLSTTEVPVPDPVVETPAGLEDPTPEPQEETPDPASEYMGTHLYYLQMVGTIHRATEAIEQLPEVIAEMTRGMAAQGVTASVDITALLSPLHHTILRAMSQKHRGKSRRGAKPGKPHAFCLVWKKDGTPVLTEDGKEIRFRNKVEKLRGPLYEKLIGPDKIDQVQLIGPDNEVISETLALAPAPGGRRPSKK